MTCINCPDSHKHEYDEATRLMVCKECDCDYWVDPDE